MVRRYCTVFLTSILVLGSFLALNGGYEGIEPIIEDEYHNARLQVNLSYEGNGSAVIGYSVSIVIQSGWGIAKYDETDPEGKAVLDLPSEYWGPMMLFIRNTTNAGVYEEGIYIEPDGDYYRNISIADLDQNKNTVKGTLYDRDSGEPIEGAEVMLTGLDQWRNGFTRSMTVGADGKYEITFPNTSYQLSLTVIGGPDHHYKLFYFHGIPDKDLYEIDLPLRIDTDDKKNIQIRMTNSTGGRLLSQGYVSAYGLDNDRDHLEMYEYDYSSNSTGWWEIMLNRGEYTLEFHAEDPGDDVRFLKEMALYINESDLSMDLQLDIPERDPLEIEVWNDTSPLDGAAVRWFHSWYDELGYSEMDSISYTDTSGVAVSSVIRGMKTNLQIYRSGYKDLYIDHFNGPIRDIGRLNVTLEKIPIYSGPRTGVEIEVIDQRSGIPLPDVWIDAYGTKGITPVSFSGYTNETGIFTADVPQGVYRIDSAHTLGKGMKMDVSLDGPGPEVVKIYIDERSEQYPDKVHSYFNVKDPSGNPVKGAVFSLEGFEWPRYNMEAVSDENGRVDIFTYPGKCTLRMDRNYLQYENSWEMDEAYPEVSGTGGKLPDIILYHSLPDNTISGHVYDSVTGHSIPYAVLYASSWIITEEPWEGVIEPYTHPGAVETFDMRVHTAPDGFYRAHYRDTLFYRVSMNGYFPEYLREDPARALVSRDFYLDPIPEYNIGLSGTVVDQDGDPVYPSEVWIWDSDRPMAGEPQFHTSTDNGSFDLFIYPGNFTISYHNETLSGTRNITVDEEGLDGLDLQLIPYSPIHGVLMNSYEEPMENVEVIIWRDDDNFTSSIITDADGSFFFNVTRGSYHVLVERMDYHEGYNAGPLVTNGWQEHYLEIMLKNRTSGFLTASVEGEEGRGPFPGMGIQGCIINIRNSTGSMVFETISGEGGIFEIELPFGKDYNLSVDPPEDYSYIPEARPGYSGTYLIIDFPYEDWTRMGLNQITLEYMSVPDIEYMNITAVHPTGKDIPLDEPIYVIFSHPVNKSSFSEAFTIHPEPLNMSILWNNEQTLVEILHDDLESDTEYTISLNGTVRSKGGLFLFELSGKTWNFTTGNSSAKWRLLSAAISVEMDRRTIVSVVGFENLSVHIVIEDLGGFELIEKSPGNYQITIQGSSLEWNKTYVYHFSNSDGGTDMAPLLSGDFTTPAESINTDDDDDDSSDDDTMDDDASDDDTDEKGSSYRFLAILMMMIILLLLAFIAILIFRKKIMMTYSQDYEE